MSFIKRRPEIRLLVEREMKAGGAHKATIVVDARREVPIEWLRIDLRGLERGSVGSGEHQTTKRWDFLNLRAELASARTLPVGRSEFPVRFELPPEVPPSYRGRSAKVEYTADVRASIPWWPDARESFEIHVAPRWFAPPEDKPLLFSSDPGGLRGREPHIEGSLAGSVFEPGGLISGALALGNVRWNDYRAIEVGLVAVEIVTLPNRTPARHDLTRYTIRLEMDEPREGASVPFRFRLPEQVPITYRSVLWRLDWHFEVEAKIRWAADMGLRVPVAVIPPAVEPGRARRRQHAPPSVGSERVEQIWREVGDVLGLELAEGSLQGREGEVELEIYREHRGRAGVFLVGRISFAPLDLRLTIEPNRGLRRHLGGGLAFAGDRWDRHHLVAARDRDQARAVGAVLGEVLASFESTHMTDDHIQVERSDSGQKYQELHAFCRNVRRLASLIEPARAAIPPPASMIEGLESWRALARELRASLETARMAVRGQLDGLAAEVITEWTPDGQPLRTLVTLGTAVPVESQYHIYLSPDPEGALDLTGCPLPNGAARALAQELLAGAQGLEICEEKLRLTLPAPLLDPTALIPRLTGLARLTVLLRRGAGPFR